MFMLFCFPLILAFLAILVTRAVVAIRRQIKIKRVLHHSGYASLVRAHRARAMYRAGIV